MPATASAPRKRPATFFSLAGVRRGAGDLSGAGLGVIAFGLAYGAAAAAKGMSAWVALSMTAIVFSGAIQFAVLELWSPHPPLVPLAILSLAINARQVFLGATLHLYLRPASRSQRLLTLALLSDANWASTTRAIRAGERDVGHLAGGGLVLWGTWLAGTALGLGLGSQISNVERYGLDVIMPAFFVLSLSGLVSGVRDLAPLAAAAGISALLSDMVPVYLAILAGAALGACVGAWCDRRA